MNPAHSSRRGTDRRIGGVKIKDKLVERRRYIRLRTPIPVTYTVSGTGSTYSAVTKDISADGLRLESTAKDIDVSGLVELKLDIYGAHNPVHAKGKIVWKKKLSLEDDAAYDIGVEFTEIEEDNKNTFLKFLCDLIYNLQKES
jgi:c-di-GMP-binding flagellar brake protein YcgR